MPTEIRPLPVDVDQRFRIRCGERLADQMEAYGISRKNLVERLATQGHEASLQSVHNWLNGVTLPRPSMQVAIARAIGVRARSIFDIEDAA